MYQLKIKAESLGLEAKRIKQDEARECRLAKKWKARAQAGRIKAQLQGQVFETPLSEPDYRAQRGLWHHRVNQVRKEARCAHLAYGLLKGKRYRDMEPFSWTQPNWDRVQKLAARYFEGDEQIILQRFAEWKDEALGGLPADWRDVQPTIRGIVAGKGAAFNNREWVEMQEKRNEEAWEAITEEELLRGLEHLVTVITA